MIKFIAFLKRREGMSFDDFREYYENTHSKIVGTISPPHVSGATSYKRTYLMPALHPIEQPTAGVDYDCITELCYADRDTFEKDMTFFGREDVKAIIAKDEENLFDRKYIRCYLEIE